MKIIYKIFVKSIFILSFSLLIVNIFNIIFPIDYRSDPQLIKGYFSKENKRILNFIGQGNRNEILQYKDAINMIDKIFSNHGESFKFLDQATKIYFISKIPPGYSWKKKYAKIKFQENWILYFIRKYEEFLINNGKKSKYNGAYIFYQSSNYKFALKRGIGICSQDAVSFANLLQRRYNIQYNIIGLGGHVIMEAKINNRYYLADPNMGLAFNFSIDEYYNNKEYRSEIIQAYNNIGRPDLIDSFGIEGNRKFKYTGPKSNANTYNPDTLTYYSNYIKWIFPLLLLLIGFYLKLKEKRLRLN